MKVVICDSNKTDLVKLHRILESGAYHVLHVCHNGRELIQWMEAHPDTAEMVCMEVFMPVLDGVAAFFEMRERGLDTRVVFSTSENTPQFVQTMIKAGAREFLQKPLERETALAKLKKAASTDLPGWSIKPNKPAR